MIKTNVTWQCSGLVLCGWGLWPNLYSSKQLSIRCFETRFGQRFPNNSWILGKSCQKAQTFQQLFGRAHKKIGHILYAIAQRHLTHFWLLSNFLLFWMCISKQPKFGLRSPSLSVPLNHTTPALFLTHWLTCKNAHQFRDESLQVMVMGSHLLQSSGHHIWLKEMRESRCDSRPGSWGWGFSIWWFCLEWRCF